MHQKLTPGGKPLPSPLPQTQTQLQTQPQTQLQTQPQPQTQPHTQPQTQPQTQLQPQSPLFFFLQVPCIAPLCMSSHAYRLLYASSPQLHIHSLHPPPRALHLLLLFMVCCSKPSSALHPLLALASSSSAGRTLLCSASRPVPLFHCMPSSQTATCTCCRLLPLELQA